MDEDSIAWKVAERAFDEGAAIVLTNTELALRLGKIQQLAEKCNNSPVIAADVTSIPDLENLFTETMKLLGGPIDFILHSVGMSPNVRKNLPYDDLNYENFMKTINISALSFHKVLQTAKKMDAINEFGSVVALSYIAAQQTYATYSDMAEAKSMLDSIARSF